MKTIIRNFLSVLRRFKMATALNVAGLAVAFAAFIVILIQINFERTFDRCHPTSGRIFRVDLTIPGTFGTILPPCLCGGCHPIFPAYRGGYIVDSFFWPEWCLSLGG